MYELREVPREGGAPAPARVRADGGQPRAPRTLKDTGLGMPALVDLCAKQFFQHGRLRLAAAAEFLKLPLTVADEALAFMRERRLVAIVGHSGIGAEAEFELTDGGRSYAAEAFSRCQYVGPAPVTLDAYKAAIELHSVRHARIDAPSVRDAFAGVVVDPQVLDQMGAAMNSGRAILLYGPPGSGKTFLAEHLAGLLPGEVVVPYAVTVGGEIIQIFDPLVHQPLETVKTDGLIRSDRDERWLRCRRPVVIAGGELTLAMLDLQFDPATRYYQAPPHVKANGGLFVVDDLGRQMVAPRDLMNRWIVPLDRNRDYLSLHTGFKFVVPFDLLVVFSTNLQPAELADEAFLRRFGYKVRLGAMDRDSYRSVFERACESSGVAFDGEAFDWLIEERHMHEGRELLACYPNDLVGRVRDFAIYEGLQARVTRAALDRAWNTYFCTPARS